MIIMSTISSILKRALDIQMIMIAYSRRNMHGSARDTYIYNKTFKDYIIQKTFFQQQEKITLFLNEAVIFNKTVHSSFPKYSTEVFLDRICNYIKASSLELKTKHIILELNYYHLSFTIRDLYGALVRNNVIEDNLMFHSVLNHKTALPTVVELIMLSNFARKNNLNIYYYQNGLEFVPETHKIEVKQSCPDAKFWVTSQYEKGLDVKTGVLTCQSPVHLFDVNLQNNEYHSIFNHTVNFERYYAEKLRRFKKKTDELQDAELITKYRELRECLMSHSSNEVKLNGVNQLTLDIMRHDPTYNSEFNVTSLFFQKPETQLNDNIIDGFSNDAQDFLKNHHNRYSAMAKFIENQNKELKENLLQHQAEEKASFWLPSYIDYLK